MNKSAACLCLLVALATSTAAQEPTPAAAAHSLPQVSVTRWPQDHSAAISLTFDDGINTDLDHAGPILKKHQLTGTFFVATAMGPWEKRKAEWKQLAQDGNELANHTVHHPCLLPEITPHSQDYTPEMFQAEIAGAASQISELTGSHRGLTFAYPCGNMSFGKPQDQVKNSALCMRYVSENSFGARGVGVGPANPDELNILDINDLGPTVGKNFSELLDLAQPALQSHNWGIFCFHGVGGDWLSITPEALDELGAYLERHSEIWTATFGDVVRYIQERKAASIQVTQSDENSLAISMQWPMDKQIFDLPLTLKVEVPGAWPHARVEADGKPLEAKVAEQATSTMVLFDVPAQAKAITVRR
jgi:peptidoglycan/xylan/chitin deacetylase (PgdA/CDA1 family)